MNDINDFYSSILNIRNVDGLSIISKVVKKQKDELLNKTDDMAGFCKYIASLIEADLKEKGIKTFWIDFNELLNVDHVVLIAEYKENGIIRRVLIDPTFTQFVKDDKYELRYLTEWPSDKIKDKNTVSALCNTGLVEVNDETFSDYISGFSKENISINLSEFLLRMRLDGEEKKLQ